MTLEENNFKGCVKIADYDMDGIMDIATETGLYPYDYTLLKFYKNLGNNIVFQDSNCFSLNLFVSRV
ncbi:MAG: hypothetical protein R2764_15685 [Bacteroidales bacterium]